MTAENVNVVLNRYKGKVSSGSVESLKSRLESSPDDGLQSLLKSPTKSRLVVFALSLLLGGLGLDRFYLGDKPLGLAKMIYNLFVSGLMVLVFLVEHPTIEIVTIIAFVFLTFSIIWQLVELYYTYKSVKVYNLSKLNYAIDLLNR